MTEQRATDWKGPVALVLAGLALLVALSGRGFPFDGPRNMAFRVEAMPLPVQPPQAPTDPGNPYGMTEPMPMMPGGPELRQELRDKWSQMWGDIKGAPIPVQPAKPEAPIPPAGGYYYDGDNNAIGGVWSYVRGVYHYFQPLLQLALFVLLGIILFTWLRRRNRPAYPAGYYPGQPGYQQGYPPPPSQPPASPAGQGNDTPPAGYPGPGVLD